MNTSAKNKSGSASGMILLIIVLLNAAVIKHAFIYNSDLYVALCFTLPLLFLTAFFMWQKNVETP